MEMDQCVYLTPFTGYRVPCTMRWVVKEPFNLTIYTQFSKRKEIFIHYLQMQFDRWLFAGGCVRQRFREYINNTMNYKR